MKKWMAVCLMLLLVLGSLSTAVAAMVDATPIPVAYVTIADAKGTPVVAHLSLDLNTADANADGKITIDEVLRAVHDLKYTGGAAAGYASAESDWGLSLTKLWGTENGGSYGYYVNNASAMSLADEVKNGDYVYAFVYTDLKAYSDTYCYFDTETAHVTAGESVTLTLTAVGFDAEYKPVTSPVEGAIITLDGQKTELKTDAEGKVTVALNNAGSVLISAVGADGKVLVPPVCLAQVDPVETKSNHTTVIVLCVVAVVVVAGVVVGVLSSKKKKA